MDRVFEALVDASLLTGLMGPKRFSVPMPVSLPKEPGLENSSFWLSEVAKINRAIMALHRRLNVLEDKDISPHTQVPMGISMPGRLPMQRRMVMQSFGMPEFPAFSPEMIESVMNTLVSSLKTATEEPKEVKPKKLTTKKLVKEQKKPAKLPKKS